MARCRGVCEKQTGAIHAGKDSQWCTCLSDLYQAEPRRNFRGGLYLDQVRDSSEDYPPAAHS
ncbi:hypothetical protein EMCG_08862 [[Emmonsia] crescens]|uniref:Uncharacterized protein n=1 Tax=[Emmonsia] crescens TaxID=73230 RepID=A0A0G2I3S4_9EURO|nr:hypothetical protein EMCG_08862 [Emmonsia crescens UAMH 3008]